MSHYLARVVILVFLAAIFGPLVVIAHAQELVGTIPVGDAPGRPGIDTERDLIYVPNLVDDTVSVIDGSTDADTVVILNRATHAFIATVPVGDQPSDVAVSETAGKVFTSPTDCRGTSPSLMRARMR